MLMSGLRIASAAARSWRTGATPRQGPSRAGPSRRELLAAGLAGLAAWAAGLRTVAAEALALTQGTAPVTLANTTRDADTGVFLVALLPDPSRARQPVIAPKRAGPEADLLRNLHLKGRASGLAGVVYDNRDRGHSNLRPEAFPQISRSVYAPPFVAEGLDYGAAGQVQFSLPVIGNSSTARKGPLPRSLGRVALAGQGPAMRSYGLYAANHLYVYPEHRDHDPERGDLLFANTPLFLLSQGSSGSDRPFLDAFALCLSAFSPETTARLQVAGLMAPTAQMVLRRTLAGVEDEAGYLSPAAHPAVFDAARLRPAAIVDLASRLDPGSVPPMVRIEMLSDFDGRPGRDYLDENIGEALFTTPAAVARAWRSYDFTRRVTLSAGGTADPNGRPLRFHWVVLQGDPQRIRVVPRAPDGAVADIEIDWQIPAAASGLASSRIDLAVIAGNGAFLSAPATFSVVLPLFQKRHYEAAPEGTMRLSSLDYRMDTRAPRTDRSIWAAGTWQDDLVYDRSGLLSGFERTGTLGRESLRFGLDGLRLEGAAGNARVTHLVGPDEDSGLVYVTGPQQQPGYGPQ